jgi:DNA-binding beta-propeller fold protein YncE
MTMARTRDLLVGSTLVATAVALGWGQRALEQTAAAQAQNGMVQAPKFEVDPDFPKPLPNHWQLGETIGVDVDAQDHVWIVHRADQVVPGETGADRSEAACCAKAPPVLAFDQTGSVIAHWGGPQAGAPYEWPGSNHGIAIDYKGNVWIGGNGNASATMPADSHILKFTQDGKFIAQFGHAGKGQGSNDTENFGKVAKIFVDPKNNEAYIADGYGNKRVAVIDADTGKFKRYWGAYGNKPDDTSTGSYNPDAPPIQQFRSPVHCAMLSVDRLVYVCDRPNDRVQVFTEDGKFVKEIFVKKKTLGDGSTWDIAFSKDPQQKYLYLADGKNEQVYVLLRETMEVLTSFGDGGRQPGQFFAVHSIAVDSKGNIYTTETYQGRRLQKFVYKGVQMVPRIQGVVWPK